MKTSLFAKKGRTEFRFFIAVMIAALLISLVTAAFAQDAPKINGKATKGKAVYVKYCLGCHGEKGNGQGPEGVKMKPTPTDFTNKEVMSKVKDDMILKIITEGGHSVGLFGMMAWADKLSPEQIQDVAAYVRTFVK